MVFEHIQHWFKRIVELGIRPESDEDERRAVWVSNAVSTVGIAVAVGFIVLDLAMENYLDLVSTLGAALIAALAIFLNARGYVRWTPYVLGVGINAAVFGGALATHPEDHGSLSFIPMILAPLVVFRLEQRRSILAFTALPALSFLLLELPPTAQLLPFSREAPSMGHLIGNVLFAALGPYVILLHFYLSRRGAEQGMHEAVRTLREQQALLLHSAKMFALGEMAAGIAHEVNNPLTAILLSVNQLKAQRAGSAESAQHVERIERTARRIGRIVEALLSFARQEQPSEPRWVALEGVFDDVKSLCSERFHRHGVELRVESPQALEAKARETELFQVLVNLLGNAFDAARDSEEKWVRLRARLEGQTVVIEVSDSGQGIPPALRERIMEPFFTTKPQGQGTGLGLSISLGLMEAMGGALRLADELAQTTFQVRCPGRRGAEVAKAE